MIALLTCCWKEQMYLKNFFMIILCLPHYQDEAVKGSSYWQRCDNHHPPLAGFGGRGVKEIFLEGVLFPEFKSPFSLATWWLIPRYGVDAAVTMGKLCPVTQDVFAPPCLCVNTDVWPNSHFVLQHTAIFTSLRRLSFCNVWGVLFWKMSFSNHSQESRV